MSRDSPRGANPPPAVIVDARWLEPPEPMVRVLDALDTLQRGERLLMLIHVEPRPLFRILERDHFSYRCELVEAGHFEVTIWHAT